jgi:hypothetical protein
MRIAALVLALVGGFIGLPAALCSGMCAVGLSEGSDAAGTAFMLIGLLGSVLGIVGGLFALKPGMMAAGMLGAATLLNALTLITFNPLSLLVVLLLLIAAILAAIGKVMVVPVEATPRASA